MSLTPVPSSALRSPAGSLGSWKAPSNLRDRLSDAVSLSRQDSFLPRFLLVVFLFIPRPHCTVSAALTAPGCRFVSEL